MAAFHPNSINTVRISIVKSKDLKTFTIFHPSLRMGRGNSIVDNAHAGGIFANIDVETGIIYTTGADEVSNNRYIFHPDTHCQIVGAQIPQWKEAIELAKEASACSTNRYDSWDLALTDQGWVIVEGNDCGACDMMQIADKRGYLEELLDLIEK